MLVGTLGTSLLGNILAGKGIVRASFFELLNFVWKQNRKRNCRSLLWKRMGFLMLPHPLTNFEIQKYYENEPRFNGVYS